MFVQLFDRVFFRAYLFLQGLHLDAVAKIFRFENIFVEGLKTRFANEYFVLNIRDFAEGKLAFAFLLLGFRGAPLRRFEVLFGVLGRIALFITGDAV